MLAVRKFVFFYCLVAPQVQGQFSASLANGNAYLTTVVDELWVKIKEHGISNLPVLDAIMEYNVTTFGVELIGPISFEDGFVQDIDLVQLGAFGFAQSVLATHARVVGRVTFTNLRLFRDFRADLTTGMKVGTVIFTPVDFFYELAIQKQHDNDTVVPTLAFNTFREPTWDIDPDDLVNNMIRRHGSLAASRTIVSGNLVQQTALAWINLFTGFLNEIVETHEFPAIVV